MTRFSLVLVLCLGACAQALDTPIGQQTGAVTCGSGGTCPDGLTCVSGTCEACGGLPKGIPSIACTTSADCPAGLDCLSGSCSTCTDPCKYAASSILCSPPSGTGSLSCTTDCDCPFGFTCSSGTCSFSGKVSTACVPGICKSDSDCASGSTCCAGACLAASIKCPVAAGSDGGPGIPKVPGWDGGTPKFPGWDGGLPKFPGWDGGLPKFPGWDGGTPGIPSSDGGFGVPGVPGLDGGAVGAACKWILDCSFGTYCCTKPGTTSGTCVSLTTACP